MTRWQRRARMGVGLFGIAFAIAVYAAISERRTVTPVQRPARLDPRAILESAGAAFQQFREAKQDFVVEAERQLTYEDGSTKFFGATIKVRNRGGRDFTVSGREGHVGENEEEIEITGGVTLTASDGFIVNAERATYNRSDSTLRVPGAVSFQKGRMSGSGVGMTYDQAADVLSLQDEARVTVTDAAGRTQTQFTAGTATLARLDKYLALEGHVNALREEQVLEADHGVARLSEDGERITFIELRRDARVSGGGAFQSMSADDMDLDYTDDGDTLERVVLRGNGGVVMNGNGDGSAGREFFGESLEFTFAPDSSLTGAIGRGNVRVDMPAAGGAPGRLVKAEAFDASGEAGSGLTSAQFSGDAEYLEQAGADRPSRSARSTSLRLAFAGDAVASAAFIGRARFEDGELQASGAQADYDPRNGMLRLSGADAGGGPRVANADVQVEADSIDVTLDGPRIVANGGVKTVLRAPPHAAARSSGSGTGSSRATREHRLPGLLQQGNAVNVNANSLDYQDTAGKAVYSGNAALWQGETAIRGNVLTLDRIRGDFIALGAARSSLVLDTGVSVGRAAEIQYNDAERRISYRAPATPIAPGPTLAPGATPAPGSASAPKPAPAPKPALAPGPAPAVPAPPLPAAAPAQLSGPEGDLRARRIELVLAPAASRVDRLEAFTDVDVRLDTRIATGDRLTYRTDSEQYVMTGIATVPVKIVDGCRETSGRTVTFFKSADRVIVDGNEEVRTQSSRSGPCPQPATR